MFTDKSYERVKFEKMHGLIANRVGIVNELLGCRYHHAKGNPCVVTSSGARHVLAFGGVDCATWRDWDLEAVRTAFGWVDVFAASVWRLSCGGFVRRVDNV